MADDALQQTATLFRVTASVLRRLAKEPIRTERTTTFVIEAYLYADKIRTADAFPPDRCLETANLLEEFADRLLAVATRPALENSPAARLLNHVDIQAARLMRVRA